MFLEIKNLTKKYGDFYAIKDINFSLEKGELLCLLGPSGCGKSTILKGIGGFIEVEGNIILNGKDITHTPPEKRGVATVFQSLGLFPHMNVIENIKYGLKFNGTPKNKRDEMAEEMLKTLGLEGFGKRMINELSGGQRQRVALGRSMIVGPELLLLDEPLSSLDAKLQKSMRQEIRDFQKKFDITTIFVTHNQEEAFEIADKIILLNEGKIMQTGVAKEIYEHPANEFVLDFIGSSNTLEDGYARPEDITLGSGTTKARIKNIIFKGSFTEVILDTEYGNLTAFTMDDEDLKIDDEINIDIKREKI
ncbi:ABC transporter ATP-binding protein [Peptoniphilus sp.]|uniref:ABC transporter ATP-binding protein n=1 Tax=Peptoniphilus sp. TaxID=1971214 RepID=UPI00399257F5